MLFKWVVFSYLTFSLEKGAFLNNGRQTRPHCVDLSLHGVSGFGPKSAFDIFPEGHVSAFVWKGIA